MNSDFFTNHCILSVINTTVNEINIVVLGRFLNEIQTYLIINTVDYIKDIDSG